VAVLSLVRQGGRRRPILQKPYRSAHPAAKTAKTTTEDDQLGLVATWAMGFGYISLRDPTTGEWHEIKASECLPGVVESANQNCKNGGRT
jgi:hypothetical protein